MGCMHGTQSPATDRMTHRANVPPLRAAAARAQARAAAAAAVRATAPSLVSGAERAAPRVPVEIK